MDDARVFLGSGGGDGIDTAVKLARRYFAELGEPERHHVITRMHGYHGTHGYGTSLAGIEPNRASFGPLAPEISQVPHDSLDALRAGFERVGPERVSAVFVEPVIGAGGVYPPPDGYLEGVAALCAEHGALFVADAVICGFGRLGIVVRRRALRRRAGHDRLRQGRHERATSRSAASSPPAASPSRSSPPPARRCSATAPPTPGTPRPARPGWPTSRSWSARAS